MCTEDRTINFESSEFIPQNDIKILRYMDFPEFLYILQYERLYFTKTSQFNDKYEEILPGIIADEYRNNAGGAEHFNEIWNNTYINSWTEFKKESYAMWHIYSKKYGIAIETTVSKLSDVIRPYNGIIRRVKYIDPKECSDMIKSGLQAYGRDEFHIENFFVLKSDCYEYENEIRAIFSNNSSESYKEIPIDNNNFISGIIISPFASKWFAEMVKDIVCHKYDLKNVKINISGVEIKE